MLKLLSCSDLDSVYGGDGPPASTPPPAPMPTTWSDMTWSQAACNVAMNVIIPDDNPFFLSVAADIACGTNLTGDNPQAPKDPQYISGVDVVTVVTPKNNDGNNNN